MTFALQNCRIAGLQKGLQDAERIAGEDVRKVRFVRSLLQFCHSSILPFKGSTYDRVPPALEAVEEAECSESERQDRRRITIPRRGARVATFRAAGRRYQ